MMNTGLLSALSSLYAQLPSAACRGCGGCCVCPSCMLSEFVFLIDYAQKYLSTESFAGCILSQPLIHAEYEGNLACMFLKDGRCLAHEGRTGSCRLFGLSALRALHIADMVYCRHNIDEAEGTVDAAFVNEWLEKLCRLENSLYPAASEPYFVNGFNIHCWLDVYFDATFDDIEVFADIRRVMRNHLDLSALTGRYECRTGLKEKVDKISILASMQGRADTATVRGLLRSIRDDYPLTGMYYIAEAQAILDSLDA